MRSFRHPIGNVEEAVGYSHLKFRGEVPVGDRKVGIISTSQILDSLTEKQLRALDTD